MNTQNHAKRNGGGMPYLKQAWHRRTQVFALLMAIPSNEMTRSLIWRRTFCMAKSVVMHATFARGRGFSAFLASLIFLMFEGVIQPSSSSALLATASEDNSLPLTDDSSVLSSLSFSSSSSFTSATWLSRFAGSWPISHVTELTAASSPSPS